MANRYDCPNRDRVSGNHTTGNGMPGRKKCALCGSALTIHAGTWGVFIHSSYNGGDARYRKADAVKTFSTEAKANQYVAKSGDERLVVRFI